MDAGPGQDSHREDIDWKDLSSTEFEYVDILAVCFLQHLFAKSPTSICTVPIPAAGSGERPFWRVRIGCTSFEHPFFQVLDQLLLFTAASAVGQCWFCCQFESTTLSVSVCTELKLNWIPVLAVSVHVLLFIVLNYAAGRRCGL